MPPSYDLAHLPPPPPSSVSKLDRRNTGRLRKEKLVNEEGRGGGGRAKSYDDEKAWSSINH
jgi:hypothetical protein